MKINKLMMTAAALILTATAARAEDQLWNNPRGWWDQHFYYDVDHKQPYNANEFSVDTFGSFLGNERHFLAFPNTSIRNGTWGGGLGANYFWSKDVGISVQSSAQTRGPRFIDHVGGDLIVRFPLQAIGLAPYVFAGGGRAFNPTYDWFGDAGAGLELRLNPKLGLFGDARYIWKEHRDFNGISTDQALLRAGLRFVF
jgi:hypothetical protein